MLEEPVMSWNANLANWLTINITHNKSHYAVQGHSRLPVFSTNRKLICDFLLVIDTNFNRNL